MKKHTSNPSTEGYEKKSHNNIASIFDACAEKIANVSLSHPGKVLMTTMMVVMAIAYGAQYLSFSKDYRVFFSDENPELVAFENFQQTYAKPDNILIVVSAKQDSVFTASTMSAVESLTEQAWLVPYASRVDSVTNFQHTWSEDDDLIVEDLFSNSANLNTNELQRLGDIALGSPLLNGSILSRDAKVTAVNVTFQFPQESLKEVPTAVAEVRNLVAEFEQKHPELDVYLSGLTMLNNAFSEAGKGDAMSLMPIMYLVLLLMIFLILRSVSSIVGTLAIVIFSNLSAIGFAGWVGINLSPISVMAPVIVMTLAIADSIHILMTTSELMAQGKSKTQAIRESLKLNFQAVTLTSLTTIVGFLALNYSDAPPFWHLGNMAAMGIFIAWLTAVITLPAIIQILPWKVKKKGLDENPGLQSSILSFIGTRVTRHYKPILWVSIAVAVGISSQAFKNVIDDTFVEYFDERVEFRTDTDFIQENLSGVYQLEFSLPSQSSDTSNNADNIGAVSEPEYLQALEKLTAWFRQQPQVHHVYSYSDIIKRLNKNMHNDDEAWDQVPGGRELAAQYLLLYEMSLPYGLNLDNRIDIDKSSSRITVTLNDASTAEIRAFLDKTDRWMKGNIPNYMYAEGTGATVMFSNILKRNTDSMLMGNVMTISIITLILIFTLGSLRFGLLSMIPNTIPILMTFGLWALIDGEVGVAAAAVTATAMGIIVDDTVHFLSKFLHARRELGYNQENAVHYAFRMVGSAMLANSIILITGFSILAYSTFKMNAQMGLLTAIAIAVALIMDFLLLPALLMLGSNKIEQAENKQVEAINLEGSLEGQTR